MSQVDDIQFLPTYGAFEKYDPEGGVDSLLGQLPPRLRKMPLFTKILLISMKQLSPLWKLVAPSRFFLLEPGISTVGLMQWRQCPRVGEIASVRFQFYLQNKVSPKCGLNEFESLGSKTTMGVGGDARWYAEPQNLIDLRTLIEGCNLLSIPRVMLGRGSNLIVPDSGYDGLVIRLKGSFWFEITRRADESLIVGAGARLKEICLQACKMEMKGFEFLEGIPGTLGGALRMNAGAMGWEIFDLVEWVSFLLPDGKIREIPGSELNVGYRHCREAVEGIALRAKLRGRRPFRPSCYSQGH